MAGLVPAIHVLETTAGEDVDPRDKPGDDEECAAKDGTRLQTIHAKFFFKNATVRCQAVSAAFLS
jgi:hypothetical protein